MRSSLLYTVKVGRQQLRAMGTPSVPSDTQDKLDKKWTAGRNADDRVPDSSKVNTPDADKLGKLTSAYAFQQPIVIDQPYGLRGHAATIELNVADGHVCMIVTG